MKYIHVFALFLMAVFCTSCKQNKTGLPAIFIKSNIIDTVMPYGPNNMVRNVKNGSNGTVLFAASFAGVFQYDGKSFTNIASKIGSRRYWDVLEDRKGNYWFASTIRASIVTMVHPTNTLARKKDLPVILFYAFMKIKPAPFGSAPEVE